jgi:hypothetical protein
MPPEEKINREDAKGAKESERERKRKREKRKRKRERKRVLRGIIANIVQIYRPISQNRRVPDTKLLYPAT